MARSEITDEVQVLRFFETGPIDKVEAVFNIVCEKMRERLRDRGPAEAGAPLRRRRSRGNDAGEKEGTSSSTG
ncbi:MAG: hypothetical protein C5B51_14840 [Terriglobia bacterium]|nr:MAG: hypothetical protein C5B51_14840 [Terriglobia bacterium]